MANKIETSRLVLIPPEENHFLTLRTLWLDSKVRQFLGGTIEDKAINTKIARLQQHWLTYGYGQYAVYEKRIQQFIGLCGFECSQDGIEIVYMFFDCFWGEGYATEAVLASIEYGFNFLDFNTVIAITQSANEASCRLLQKVGMRHIHNLYRYNAEQCLYRVVRQDWLELKSFLK